MTDKKISVKEHKHVLKVCDRFKMKTMKDYHDLLLKCDVLLLVDLFEAFRNSSLKNYGLYPSHCLIAPALGWDAMLNMTKGELEIISDADMQMFSEKGMRDGAFYISREYSKTNNKYLKSYNPKQELKHILYLDANNLCGNIMLKLKKIHRVLEFNSISYND